MRSLAGSLGDSVLANDILIPPRPTILLKKGRGRRKKYRN